MAKASRPTVNWIGHTIAGRYKIEALLGQGGMSSVYKATDPNLQRTVAIKLIHPHLSSDAQFVRRFEQEAAAIAQLRHSNIIQVYDFNHDDKVYYMVMEYVPGQNLKDRLSALSSVNRRFPLEDTIQIMATICEAAAYAHEQNMIHRDLKPANVMITPKGQPVLMDFGVAKMLDGIDHTATGAIVGTAKYLSPEQARGERPDERSDIYSLGVMLYEMLTGQPPFDADTTVAVLMKHVNEPIPDIRKFQSNFPDELVNVVQKALVKDRRERYQTAAQMAADLRAIKIESEAAKKTMASKKVTDESIAHALATPPELRDTDPAPISRAAPLPQAKNRTLWVMGGLAALLLLLLVGGAIFVISAFTPSSEGTEKQKVVQNVTEEAIEEQATVPSEEQDLPSSEKMVQIKQGAYTVGLAAADGDHVAAQKVELADFWIDQYEVSNAQYAEFLAGTDQQPPADWPGGKIPAEQEQHPVKGVTWEIAQAYCDWANKRLPREAEWEVAARGPEGRLFPWGDNPRAVELPRSGTYKVGGKLTNQSPFGLFDMAGNVWEWVDEPYVPLENENNRLLRGGSNDFLKDMAYRLQGDPNMRTMFASAGIRCAADQVRVIETDQSQAQQVLYQDDFADPGSGWPIASEGILFFGYHPPDFFHVEVGTEKNHTVVALPAEYGDVTVEAEVLVDHTTSESGDFRYGLAFRQVAEDQYYAFAVSSRSGAWYVLKSSSSGLEVLKEGKVETLQGFAPQGFTPDKTDVLRVDANGPNFVFHINGQIVAQLSQADYAKGQVGFFVENFNETLAHIHYDSITIREAEVVSAPVVNVLYEDQFTDQASGWLAEDKEGAPYRVGYHPPDYYHVEVRAPNDNIAVSQGENFGDVTVETSLFVDFTDTEGGDFRYGLALRRKAADQYYAFTVSSRQGSWSILKQAPSGLEVLAEGTVDTLKGFAPPGFSPNEKDALRVDAQGDTFVFHINGKPIAQVKDAAYDSGEIGFYVETFDETLAHVHYDSLLVREVELAEISQLPPTSESPQITPSPVSDTLPTATTAAMNSILTTPPEGMVLIPAGSFLMGSATGEANEAPEHEVSLNAFFIDQYEVSNAQYRECVEAKACTQTVNPDSYTYTNYRDDPTYDNYPMVGVTWDQAVVYCQWLDKRLPTEAEWEYAAGGPENLTWPWGNTFDPQLSAAGKVDTQPVDSYPDGVSPFGLYNMAGNVNEWVQDVFVEGFYANSPEQNPLSEGSSPERVFRGGSFDNTDGAFYTTSRRYIKNRAFNDVDIGFRCAMDVSS
jgi:serine/threonine-protein kinase